VDEGTTTGNGGQMLRRKGCGGLRTLVDYWMPRRKEEGPVAWPQRDEEKADSGMAFTIGFSSQYLRFHGCLCWLMLRWITSGLQQAPAALFPQWNQVPVN
jgi:hypothetical protein